MAKGKKTGGRSFKPGNKANPKGGGALSPKIRAIRKITNEHIEEVADVILDGNLDKLKGLLGNPDSSVLKVWLAKAAAEGIRKGDIYPLDLILNRVIGKPKDKVEVTGKDGEPLRQLSDAEIDARLQLLMGKGKK